MVAKRGPNVLFCISIKTTVSYFGFELRWFSVCRGLTAGCMSNRTTVSYLASNYPIIGSQCVGS
jgi:hypothetical protein